MGLITHPETIRETAFDLYVQNKKITEIAHTLQIHRNVINYWKKSDNWTQRKNQFLSRLRQKSYEKAVFDLQKASDILDEIEIKLLAHLKTIDLSKLSPEGVFKYLHESISIRMKMRDIGIERTQILENVLDHFSQYEPFRDIIEQHREEFSKEYMEKLK